MSIQKVAIFGSKFPISTVSPTAIREMHPRYITEFRLSNKKILHVRPRTFFLGEEGGGGGYGLDTMQESKQKNLTVVPVKLPPYFPRAPFIFENPRVKMWEIVISAVN